MTLPADAGDVLLPLARAAIAARFAAPASAVASGAGWLDDPGASFVTLTLGGRLRGCIGSIEAHRPLREDVAGNAVAAAFHDRRFPPLTAPELDAVRVEVSVLTPPAPLPAVTRSEALARLRPGVHGVVVRWRGHGATFLPQVWEQLPDAGDFLEHLWRKAGMPPEVWDDKVRLSVYTVASWAENGGERHDDDHDAAPGPLVARHRGRPAPM